MVWRRCNPEFPLKYSLAALLVTTAVVPAMRVLIYKRLNVPYIFASAVFTSREYKETAMAFYACAFSMNLTLPYVVHLFSKELSQGHVHFVVFGHLLIGFALYCMFAD